MEVEIKLILVSLGQNELSVIEKNQYCKGFSVKEVQMI